MTAAVNKKLAVTGVIPVVIIILSLVIISTSDNTKEDTSLTTAAHVM